MSNSLLPPNASATEQALEATLARIDDVPIPLRQLRDPHAIPAQLLPWLAWARSVDNWHNSWSEAQKREVVAASYEVHKRKGTAGAVKQALGALGYATRIVEWFETGSAPYTFQVEVGLTESPVSEAALAQIQRIVERTKNTRSHYTLNLVAQLPGKIYFGAAMASGEFSAVYPYQATTVSVRGTTNINAGTTSFEITQVSAK